MAMKFISEHKQKLQDKYGEYVEWSTNKFLNRSHSNDFKYKVGDLIHLFSKSGMYRICNFSAETVGITCKRWVNEFKRKERPSYFQVVKKSDIKCKAGGRHNIYNEK